MFSTYEEARQALSDAGILPGDPLSMSIEEARRRQSEYFAWLGQDLPEVAARQDVTIEGPIGPVTLRIVRPHLNDLAPAALFVRGAGWWAGDLDSHERNARIFANASGMTVCVLDYHRSPEHRYPVQRNEVLAAIRWLRTDGHRYGINPTRIVLWGESAGATLALCAAQALHAAGETWLRGLVLFYGNYEAPGLSDRPYSRWVYGKYLGNPDLLSDPQAVPLLAPMRGLPPTWLGVGEMDPLIGATLALSQQLEAARVAVELVRFDGLPHAFVSLARILRAADAGLRVAARAACLMTS